MPHRSRSLLLAAILVAAPATADTSISPASSLIAAIPAPPKTGKAELCGDSDRAELLRSLIDRCANEKDPILRRGCRHLRRTLRDCEEGIFRDRDMMSMSVRDDRHDDHSWYASWTREHGRWSVDVLSYEDDCYED